MRDVLISGCGGDGMTAITRGKQEWPTRPWPTDAEVLGEVTWAARPSESNYQAACSS